MKLRKSKSLKFFAILLFSFEMIAPALISCGNPEAGVDQNQRAFTNATHLPNFLYSLVFEENNGEGEGEEERESKDHKANFCFTDFGFVQAYIALTTVDTRQTSWVETHETRATKPPIFALSHAYLI